MVKWNNLFISALLVTCIAGGAWLLYAGTPIINSLDHLTNTMVAEVCARLLHSVMGGTSAVCGRLHVCGASASA